MRLSWSQPMQTTKNPLDSNDFQSQKPGCLQTSELDKMGSVFYYHSLNYLVMHGTLSPLYPSVLQYAARSYSTGYCRLTCYSCIYYALYLLCLYERDVQPTGLVANYKKNKNKIKGSFSEAVQLNPQENEISLLGTWSSIYPDRSDSHLPHHAHSPNVY